MKIYRAYKYRIYPNNDQKILISKHIGCCRYIYNYGLSKKIKCYQEKNKSLSRFDIQKDLPILKRQEETKWLSEINSQSLQVSLDNLDKAYVRFFKEKKGFPKFKSKKNPVQSFQAPQGGRIESNKLYIPKFLEGIKLVYHRQHEGIIKSVTISKTSTDKYFVSVLCEQEVNIPKSKIVKEKTTIGIDMGIKDFMIMSNGIKIQNNKFLKQKLKKLKRSQKSLCRKVKGSNNRKKQVRKVAIIHEKVRNTREDFLHKTSYELVNDNQIDTIIREDLAVSNMVQNHKLSLYINDVSWSKFFNFLEYKTYFKSKNILKIGRYEPSSKICNHCGYINNELTLKDRVWICKECKTEHDRDINAAINIKKIGLSKQNIPQGLRKSKPMEILQW